MSDFPDHPHLDSDGVWAQVASRPLASAPQPALFLDRDGVLVEEVNYLHRVEDLKLIHGATNVIAAANRRDIPVVIVTNQAGIGRRYYDWPEFEAVQRHLIQELDRAGVRLAAIYACPFHADARAPYRHPDHPARKPNPGMLTKAAGALGLDVSKSWLIGDRATDIRAARNAGCAGAMHVRSGHGIREDERLSSLALATSDFRVLTGESVFDALKGLPLITD